MWDQQSVNETDRKLQNLQRLLAWGGEESIQERVGLELSLNYEAGGEGTLGRGNEWCKGLEVRLCRESAGQVKASSLLGSRVRARGSCVAEMGPRRSARFIYCCREKPVKILSLEQGDVLIMWGITISSGETAAENRARKGEDNYETVIPFTTSLVCQVSASLLEQPEFNVGLILECGSSRGLGFVHNFIQSSP